jgi:HSP20 family protein
MSITRWNPQRELSTVSNEFENFLNSIWNSEDSYLTKFNPTVDIEESENGYTFHAELPGLEKKDVNITVKDNILTISGEKARKNEDKKRNFHRIESSYGKFQRCFKLPQNIKQDEIKADFNNGILNISIPLAEEAKPREITIA